MIRTSLSFLDDEELMEFALNKDDRTEMEVELAQRLMTAVDYIDELEQELEGE